MSVAAAVSSTPAPRNTSRPAKKPTPFEQLENFFYRPIVAVPLAYLIMAVALQISPWAWNCLPGLKNHLTASTLVIGGAVLFILVLSRFVDRKVVSRVNVLMGGTIIFLLGGWKCFLLLLALNLVCYYVFLRYLPIWASMVAATISIIGTTWACKAIHVSPIWGGPWTRGVLGAFGLGAVRLLLYLYDYPAVRKQGGSLIDMLSFGQFTLILWPGFPTPCYQYYAVTPREKTDRLGSAQLLVGTGKTLAWCVYLALILKYVPSIETIFTWSIAARCLLLYSVGVMALWRAAPLDLATGTANLCGFMCPDSYHNPLGAKTYFGFWQRWLVPVNDFMLRMFAYPIARRIKKAWLRALVLFVVVSVVRMWWHNIGFGYIRPPGWKSLVLVHSWFFAVEFVAFLTLGMAQEWLLKRVPRLGLSMWLLTSITITAIFFPFFDTITTQWQASDATLECVHAQFFKAKIDCRTPEPPAK